MSETIEKQRRLTFAQATTEALDEALAMDDRVFLLGEDIADREGGNVFKICKGLSTKYGDHRVRSTPISEEAIVGAAVGAALAGMRPVAEVMMMNFVTVAMDQIVNHAAKLRYMSGGQTSVPLTVRMATGVGRGTGGQHADMWEAWFAHVPGLKVVVPSTPADHKGLLLSCIFDEDPCIFIENMVTYFKAGPAPEPGARIPLGKANVLRPGSALTIVGYGHPILHACAVADTLAAEGVEIEVVDLRTISPWDQDTVLSSVRKTGRAVIVHDAVQAFGVGAELSARINQALFGELKAPVLRVGAPFTPVPFSKPLEAAYAVNQADIENAVRKTLEY